MFSGKKQSRIWLVSVLYRSILKEQPLVPLSKAFSLQDLEEFFDDEVIFSYEKGDLEYFIQVYNSFISNMSEIKQKLANLLKVRVSQVSPNHFWLEKSSSGKEAVNPFIYSCLILAITEIEFMGIEAWIVISAYKELIRNYTPDGSEKLMNIFSKTDNVAKQDI